MFKKLVDGLIFGAGFGVAFVGIWIVAMYYLLPAMLTQQVNSSEQSSLNENVISKPPTIRGAQRFLGSSGIYSNNFIHNKSGVLATGEGVITGAAQVNGKPLRGLKLRLALNGRVISQWAESDAQGNYHVSVPYGDYQIDGYELELSAANKSLPGKISHPENRHSSGKFRVSVDQVGRGLKLRFVDPIIKDISKTRYSPSESVVLRWLPYSGANEYTVQVYEKSDADSWKRTPIFDWPDRPSLFGTELDLSQHDIQLKSGHFYSFEVEAKNENIERLSNTHTDHQGFDFEVTE